MTTYIYIRTYIHTYTHTLFFISLFVYVHGYVYVYVDVDVDVDVDADVYIDVYIGVYTDVYRDVCKVSIYTEGVLHSVECSEARTGPLGASPPAPSTTTRMRVAPTGRAALLTVKV